MAKPLLEQVNPFGNVQAVVEIEHKACYFYLHGSEQIDFNMRSVWVRNLASAPETLDRESMMRGNPPLNPRRYCVNAEPGRAPRSEDLRIVWLPEGNGAALLERGEIIAILPPWADNNGFPGYARDAVGDGPLAWELRSDNALIERFAEAERYWDLWDGDPWPAIADDLTSRVEAKLGPRSNYYAIDGGEWPPKALLRIPLDGAVALITIGVSVLPQPNVELSTEDPQPLRRIELGAILPDTWSDDAIKRFAAYISGQSKLPWTNYTWLGHGHTIPCDSWRSPKYTFAMLTRSHPAAQAPDLGPQFGDPVTLLWFLPITAAEQQVAETQGSESLLARLPRSRWQDA